MTTDVTQGELWAYGTQVAAVVAPHLPARVTTGFLDRLQVRAGRLSGSWPSKTDAYALIGQSVMEEIKSALPV